MREISSNYRVLEVNGKKFNRYKTLYYDTAGLDLYEKHHNGKLNRYKIRHRTYVESNTGFLEVKFKTNKGRTIKTRVTENEVPMVWKGDAEGFLTKTLPFSPNVLQPVLWVNYSRCTLVHKTDAERLTIDTDLEFIKGDVNKQLTGLIIAEVKQDKKKPSPFIKMMKKYHIREGSISKYCMGIALTCGEVKKNNFKRKLMAIRNMIHYDNPANN
ncbi:MAG: polyphosphate polymerase domain-containing protein, partial [Bacteroidia bacterium]